MLDAVFAALPFPAIVFDRAGRTLAFNQAMCDATGLPAEAFRAADDRRLIGLIDWRRADGCPMALDEWPWHQPRALQEPWTRRLVIARPGGRALRIDVTVTVFQHAGSDAFLAVGQDVTEAALAADRLRESEEQYRSLFEASVDAIFLTRPDGSIVAANPAACRLFGMTEQEICRAGRAGLVVQDAAFDAALRARAERGEARTELTFIRKDGTRLTGDTTSVIVPGHASDPRAFAIVRDATDRKRTEDALRAGEERYRALVEIAPLALFVNRANTIVYANPAALTLFGADSPEQLLGKSPFDLFDPSVHANVAARIGRLELGQPVPLLEERIVRLDGTPRDVEVAATPFVDREGPAIQVVLKDITERKRAEDALRERNDYIETILENAPIGFAVNTIDDGAGRFVSQRFESIYGVPPGSMQTVADYFENVFRDPAVREDIRARMMADVASGDASRMRWEALPVTTGSGEQRFVTAINIPLLDRNLMVSTAQDVTDRVRAEAEILRTNRLYAALSQVNQAIARVQSRDELFAEVTRALVEFGGFQMVWIGWLDQSTGEVHILSKRGDSSGYLDGVRIFVDDRPEGQGPAGVAIRENRPYICNDFLSDPRTASRRLRAAETDWRAAAVFPIHLGGAPCGGLMVYAREPGFFGEREVELLDKTAMDVSFALDHLEQEARRREAEAELRTVESERQRLELQLAQAQKMEAVGQLAGGVAHDFNNMLSVIMGHSEMALIEAPPGSALRHDLEEILEAARRSADLTRQLLAFARRQTIKPEVLDLNGLVTKLLKMLQRLIGEGITLRWQPANGLWLVCVDPSQIDQMLANLVVNARDAMAGAGTLRIATDNVVLDPGFCRAHAGFRPGEFVRLTVSDSGAGMSREVLDRIFEPFFTTKSAGKGTGLGLATVFGVVKQNDGFIDVRSEPNAGTTFRIWLPRAAATPAGAEHAPLPESAPLGTETLLVVEDARPILKITETILAKLGYTVLAACSPDEAIDLAAAHAGRIHLLVSDVIMPGMNGRELADRLLASHAGLKCLFMSGYTADIIAPHGVLEEGTHFVQKPFTITALAHAVREALDSPTFP